jgi:hypothetical protein
MSSPARILVVVHRNAATPKLPEHVLLRARQGPCSFVLLVSRPYWADTDASQTDRAWRR